MDFNLLKYFASSAVELHNTSAGLSIEIFVVSFLIYSKVWKKVSVKVASQFQRLITALEIHSNTLNEHSRQLGEHADTIENHEKRIVVLETKP